MLKQIQSVKKASYSLINLSVKERNAVLITFAANLRNACQTIISENQKDLALMPKDDPKYDRLLLTEERIHAIANDVEVVASLPFIANHIMEEIQRPNGLRIQKRSVPLGVVAVIYESRPNVTSDVFSLCFKTGNACILKGGKEAHYSNQCLVSLIQKTLEAHKVDSNVICLLPSDRKAIMTLLNAVGLVDVCIPRGSQTLINFVRENAKVPIIETGAGIVHTYFDASGDLNKGRSIIENAKTRRVSVCNALDSLVIHESCLDKLYTLVSPLSAKNVEIFADKPSYNALKLSYPPQLLHKAKLSDFGQEFLSYKMSIKTVKSIEEAVEHIMHYTSGHSEAIISEDKNSITYFLDHIDAAAVYVNTSTAFTDGGQFGMGAEIGISTQKLHARGPMSLEALTSYKWVIWGDGHIR